MDDESWTAVDAYVTDRLLPADETTSRALNACAEAGLPEIQVTPPLAGFLHLLALSIGARSILEIGTLGGYSGIWLARALPAGGRLVTLEVDPRHADVARANFEAAGLSDLIDLRLGPALETLPMLEKEGAGPFDLVFIDADKPPAPEYFEWALRLSRGGSVIVVDNVVRKGAVADPRDPDPSVQGVRKLHDQVGGDSRVRATTIQTVGAKGHDGFLIAHVLGAP